MANSRGHWIIISLEFDEVSQDEAIQSLSLHGAGNIEDGIIGIATYNLSFRGEMFLPIADLTIAFTALTKSRRELIAQASSKRTAS